MQLDDTALITKVACHMVAKYRNNALRHAEMRALELREGEPRAAARWHLVANAIGMLYDDALVSQD